METPRDHRAKRGGRVRTAPCELRIEHAHAHYEPRASWQYVRAVPDGLPPPAMQAVAPRGRDHLPAVRNADRLRRESHRGPGPSRRVGSLRLPGSSAPTRGQDAGRAHVSDRQNHHDRCTLPHSRPAAAPLRVTRSRKLTQLSVCPPPQTEPHRGTRAGGQPGDQVLPQ